jgi:hypothetical protein
MTYIRNSLILLAFVVISGSAFAQSMTGQQLLYSIEQPRSQDEKMQGIILVGNVTFKSDGISHCKPPNATVAQAVAITEKFLKDNPRVWNLEAVDITSAALSYAWPCKRK